ncbi:MAG TPA: hypothetical protein VN726_15275 [Hanamia sp.]|nr:hypothetical protein [Hanamia sp.]
MIVDIQIIKILLENASLNDLMEVQEIIENKKLELYQAVNEYDEKCLHKITKEELTRPHIIALTQNRRN